MPYGLLTPGQVFALYAQRHMIEFGTTPEQLARIPLACRERANANPRAQMHDRKLTIDDYLGVADDLHRRCACSTSASRPTASCAVVVTTTERAADLAAAAGADPGRHPGDDRRARSRASMFPVLAGPNITELPAEGRRRRALPAGRPRARSDIDVAQLYDCFSITVLLQLEDWGFCAKGEGGQFVDSGAIDLGGSAADQHRRRPPVGGLHPRSQPRRRRRAPDPRRRRRRRCPVPRRASSRRLPCRPAAP